MQSNYEALKQKLKYHLVDSGFTYSPEKEPLGYPIVLREKPVDTMLNTLLDYLTGEGYEIKSKTNS